MNAKHRGMGGRASLPRPFPKLLLNKKGSSYIDLIIKTLVVITLMATVISFLGVFTAYLNLNHMCRRVVRVAELEGQIAEPVFDVFDRLKQQTKLVPEMTVEDVAYCDAQNQKIQLRDTFTITMAYSYAFTLFKPSFAPAVQIIIPMRVRITGMSEKYWKLPE